MTEEELEKVAKLLFKLYCPTNKYLQRGWARAPLFMKSQFRADAKEIIKAITGSPPGQ